jgi:predicted Zn-dependent protease
LIPKKYKLIISFVFLFSVTPLSLVAQTYRIGPNGSVSQRPPNGKQAAGAGQLGWGSNIQSARLARATELALKQSHYAMALDYAERAARSAPNNPQLWFLCGYAARLAHNFGVSVNAYRRGLALSASSVEGQAGLAQTYILMGREKEAETLLRKVVAESPGQPENLVLLGNTYIEMNDYKDAIRPLQRAEGLKPTPRTELLLAVVFEHLNRMGEASHYLHMAEKRSPNNPDIERSLANFYTSSGDYAKAITRLRAIKNPGSDVVAQLGYTYKLAGHMKQSARSYAQAARAMPRDLGVQIAAARAEVAANQVNQANPFLQRAAAINPNDYRIHAMRAELASMNGQQQKAAEEYQAALANLPASPSEGPLYRVQLHLDLRQLYVSLDHAKAAQQQLADAQNEIEALHIYGQDRADFLRTRALVELEGRNYQSASRDIDASLQLNPRDPNSLLLDGQILTKLNRLQGAFAAYQQALAVEPENPFALTSLGYISRANGNNGQAEKYFKELAKDHPSYYVPYLALGDLYTDLHRYSKAEDEYRHAYQLAPANPLIVAGGVNAAIEQHKMQLAMLWYKRILPAMQSAPRVMAQQERYLNLTGKYGESVSYGQKAIQYLPDDRDVVVYLGYDYLHLGDYAQLKLLTHKYMSVLTHEPDIPLLAGYVYEHEHNYPQAVNEFTETIHRDPTVVTAYVNRGFLLNRLKQPKEAASSFTTAVHLEPRDGRAHLGLAFAELSLNQNEAAVQQSEDAEKYSGDSEPIHVIRATAYGREGMLAKAALEYKAALRLTPRDGTLHFGLANVYFNQHHYEEAVKQARDANQYLPADPDVYALMARSYAYLKNRPQTEEAIRIAERDATEPSKKMTGKEVASVYISTGEAFSTLGDHRAAMDRYSRALSEPNSNRVDVRLAIARLMATVGETEKAEREIALAQMESDADVTPRMTGAQYLQAASLFQQLHEYDLARTYLMRAEAAGAPDLELHVAMANNDLALGETHEAAGDLAAIKQSDRDSSDYSFLLAKANLYEQEQRGAAAVSAFAQAAYLSGGDSSIEQAQLNAVGSEGYSLNDTVSVFVQGYVQPIFEDGTVYVLDSKLDSPGGPVPESNIAQLPPPRSSVESASTFAYHLHLGSFPNAGGFVEERDTRGTISVPATGSIVHRNTVDTIMNFGVAPALHVGSQVVTLDGGVQGTIRRDTLSPVEMNQNILREFVYISTSSFFNAVSATGYVIHDSGPFTQSPINEHSLSSSLDFRVGAPWSKTALVTGWGATDQNFDSKQLGNGENYFTSSYVGLSRRFGKHLNVQAIVEDVRSWRVEPYSPIHSAISQGLRPAGTIDLIPSRHWRFHFSTAYESTRGFHVYDMNQNSFALTYIRPLGRVYNQKSGKLELKYPIRISAGLEEQSFPSFTQGPSTQFRPYISIQLF